jgi:hypothetical protein
MEVVVITSVINTSNNPLNYSSVRSVFTPEERFDQTIVGIESVRKHIQNAYIVLVEASNIDTDKSLKITEKVDLYLNFSNDYHFTEIINGPNKSYGEAQLLLKFFLSDKFKEMNVKNVYKLSGRYFLDDAFDINQYDNEFNCFKSINRIDGFSSTNIVPEWYISAPSYFVSFYKITKQQIEKFVSVLKDKSELLITRNDVYHMDIEHLICTYFKENIKFVDNLGVSGNVAVGGGWYSG